MTTIKFSLGSSSIEEAIEKVEKYANKIKSLDEDIVKTVVASGTDEAKNMAIAWEAYDSGELYNGIIGEVDGKKGKIWSTAPHSMYVELGTGITGDRNPHPEKVAVGWVYDVNKHGDKGWFYRGDDGKLHWTKGMPARPFMYDTAQILKQALPYLAKDLLKEGDEP